MNSHISVSKSCCSLKTKEVSRIKIIFKIFMRQCDKVLCACGEMENQRFIISSIFPYGTSKTKLAEHRLELQSRDTHCVRDGTSQAVGISAMLYTAPGGRAVCPAFLVPKSKQPPAYGEELGRHRQRWPQPDATRRMHSFAGHRTCTAPSGSQ